MFGKRMHGISAVPGGVQKGLIGGRARPLPARRGGHCSSLDQVMEYAQDGLRLWRDFHREHRDEVDSFAPVALLDMSLVGADGNVDYYDGRLRVVDEDKNVVDRLRLPRLPRPLLRGGRALELPEVPLPHGTRPRGGLGPGRLPGPDERHRDAADAAGGRGAGGVPRLHGRPGQHDDAALQLGARHRDHPRRRADPRPAQRPRPAVATTWSSTPARTPGSARASASSRRRAARCCTTTAPTATAR